MIGEQPGDKEDLAGKPFVGPAGKVLDECLTEAGIDRSWVYVTNAVKHFKWVPSGGRRLHKKPSVREMRACLPWLESELQKVHPEVVVCLGSVAAQSLLGTQFKVTQHRGEFLSSPLAERVLATIHPSSILRMPDREARQEARAMLVEDLRLVGAAIGGAEQIRTAE